MAPRVSDFLSEVILGSFHRVDYSRKRVDFEKPSHHPINDIKRFLGIEPRCIGDVREVGCGGQWVYAGLVKCS
jgi:hypothetical protein